MKFLLFSLLLLLASPGWALPPEQTTAPEQLTPEQVKHNAENFHILDVRSSEEYAEGHVPGAVNIPHDSIQAKISSLPQDKDAPVVLYCRTGRRAGLAATELESMGYDNLFLMQGDMPGWTEKGFDISHD
ncbi:rhodanese-like domain-containing protein [Lacimicrobium alkaliphilum]|uniref:Rhodanese domain-containing protein n=1 Tax=Lacimicrobium alkaliphilum TaxID=1526571 RepID=A0A0U2QJR4_9ALTE|nr:rhodanese-like domain-containing protein [Lacimicrobium alkaliphilum]ALS97355.1 hypothetical protein AT746_03080 [Lacimicrobium alkaliphilum]